MNDASNVFTLSKKVVVADIDELQHVNNVVYLQWVQDVASAHWQNAAPEEVRQKYSWVVLKHEIEYLKPAKLNDVLLLRTWVATMDGVKSERCVEIYHQASNTLLARAKTQWCLLDAKSLKPKRIEEDIRMIFS